MKLLFPLSLLSLLSLLSFTSAGEPLCVGGRTFRDATVAPAGPHSVRIRHAEGVTVLPAWELHVAQQRRFGLEPAAVEAARQRDLAAAEQALALRNAERRRAESLDAQRRREAAAAASLTAAEQRRKQEQHAATMRNFRQWSEDREARRATEAELTRKWIEGYRNR